MSNTQGEHREASEHTFSPLCVCVRGCITFAVCFHIVLVCVQDSHRRQLHTQTVTEFIQDVSSRNN